MPPQIRLRRNSPAPTSESTPEQSYPLIPVEEVTLDIPTPYQAFTASPPRDRTEAGGEPAWSLERDGITQGLLNRFMSCPERFRLGYVEGLGYPRTSGALAFGSLIHEALDMVYSLAKDLSQQGGRLGTDQLPAVVDAVLAALWEKDQQVLQGLVLQPEQVQEEMHFNYATAKTVLGAYFEYNQQDFSNWRWEALEREFSIPYTYVPSGPRGGRDRATTFPLRGKIDGIFRIPSSERPRGNLWLFETKTKAHIEESSIVDKLSFDTQVMLYLWAIRHLYGGEFPQGVVYNLIRRPQLRQGRKESTPEFLERIKEDVWTRPQHYFLRYNVSILEDEQRAWEAELYNMVGHLIQWQEGGLHYRNSTACTTRLGICEYLAVCGRGDRSGFVRKDQIFPELSGSAPE